MLSDLIPEPSNGSRLVVDNGPTASCRLRLFWRDDTEAKRWNAQPDERWFDDSDSDPLAWSEVCRGAENVYAVSDRPLTADVTEATALDVIAAAIRVADSGPEHGTHALASAISAALDGIGAQWHPATIREVIGEVDGWDEIGAAELAHHVAAGLRKHAAGTEG